MNRLLLTIILSVILIVLQASPAAASRYPNPYRQTMWNDFTDALHTLGQTPQQAKISKMRLHNARAMARLRSIAQARHRTWLKANSQ